MPSISPLASVHWPVGRGWWWTETQGLVVLVEDVLAGPWLNANSPGLVSHLFTLRRISWIDRI
jgi:hypothetical protein